MSDLLEQNDNVVELYDANQVAESSISRGLAEFFGDVPYDLERYQSEVKMLYCMGGILKYEIGRRLIAVWEHERGKSGRAFAQFINTFFPDIPVRRAYEDMRYAAKAAKHPLFRNFAEGKGNFSKALALLETVEEGELEQFEETGEILGLPVEELDRLSVRELKTRIKKLERDKKAAVLEAVDKVGAENVKLREQVEALEASQETPGLEAARKLIRQADRLIHEAIQLLRKVDWALVGNNWDAKIDAMQKLDLINRMMGSVEYEIHKYEPEPEETEGRGQ